MQSVETGLNNLVAYRMNGTKKWFIYRPYKVVRKDIYEVVGTTLKKSELYNSFKLTVILSC